MNSKEIVPHPTGNFPSVEEEILLRFGFMDKSNSVLKIIRKRLGELGLKGKRNLPLNVLAFYYGVYFYNLVSRHSLFAEDEKFPIKIIANPKHSSATYVLNNLIYINVESRQAKETYYEPVLGEIDISEYYGIAARTYIVHLIDGLEEANHLHLEHLHQKRKPNSNGRTNHRFPNELWEVSGDDPISYRAKLWHEFAALIVQKAYLNYYISGEYPETVGDFNNLYREVAKARRLWTKRQKRPPRYLLYSK